MQEFQHVKKKIKLPPYLATLPKLSSLIMPVRQGVWPQPRAGSCPGSLVHCSKELILPLPCTEDDGTTESWNALGWKGPQTPLCSNWHLLLVPVFGCSCWGEIRSWSRIFSPGCAFAISRSSHQFLSSSMFHFSRSAPAALALPDDPTGARKSNPICDLSVLPESS